mmetsp:Transcript_97772/g.276720  ORF Transcript_97772/g.276720 Transcript_97772/m.276720 type:complete len:207 (-) Transcript_97772:1245-1865(-)
MATASRTACGGVTCRTHRLASSSFQSMSGGMLIGFVHWMKNCSSEAGRDAMTFTPSVSPCRPRYMKAPTPAPKLGSRVRGLPCAVQQPWHTAQNIASSGTSALRREWTSRLTGAAGETSRNTGPLMSIRLFISASRRARSFCLQADSRGTRSISLTSPQIASRASGGRFSWSVRSLSRLTLTSFRACGNFFGSLSSWNRLLSVTKE